VDWDNDGKLDIIAGDTKGQVWFFRNEGTAQAPRLAAGVLLEAGGEPIVGTPAKYEKNAEGKYELVPNEEKMIGIYSKLHVADFNGDGLADLLVGQNDPGGKGHDIVIYRNIGTKHQPKLAAPEPLTLPEPKMSRPSPCVVDWDRDGVVDLLCGTERSEVYFFRNTGTNAEPKLADGRKLALDAGEDFEKGYRCRIDVTDWNNDGVLDLLVGNFYSHQKPMGGNVWLFLGR